MAFTRALIDGWILSDGILEPFCLSSPMNVRSAVEERGLLKGVEARAGEWLSLRTWRYAASFDAPGEEYERLELRFESLSGRGTFSINGAEAGRFLPGEARFDITGELREKNVIELRFDAEPSAHPSDEWTMGITGGVFLRATSAIVAHTFRVEAHGGEQASIIARLRYTAHTPGRYLFRYQVLLDGEIAAQQEIREDLRAAQGHLKHQIAVPHAQTFDALRPEESNYLIRLTIERAGIGCEALSARAAFHGAEPPERACLEEQLRSDRRDEYQARLRLLWMLRANAVYARGSEDRLLVRDTLLHGLYEKRADERALRMDSVGASNAFIDQTGEAFRYAGGDALDRDALYAVCGDAVKNDAAMLWRVVRHRQAEQARATAEKARREGRPALICRLMDEKPRAVGCALVEADGRMRPAFGALRNAWRAMHAGLELPDAGFIEPGGISRIPVYLFCDEQDHVPVTVTVRCLAMDGTLVAGTSFAALPCASRLLGEVTLTAPDESCALVLRAEIGGAGENVSDALLCVGRAGTPFEALGNLPRAAVSQVGEKIVNTGGTAAVGLFAAWGDDSFYGALLPGEQLVVENSLTSLESLNADISLK